MPCPSMLSSPLILGLLSLRSKFLTEGGPEREPSGLASSTVGADSGRKTSELRRYLSSAPASTSAACGGCCGAGRGGGWPLLARPFRA